MKNFLSIKKLHRQFYSQKVFKSAHDAVKDIKDGSKILVGGFGKKTKSKSPQDYVEHHKN
jgi:hypothetical protein